MQLIVSVLKHLSWKVALYWLVLLGALWAFVELADEVYEQEGFFFDEPILNWFYTLLDPTLTSLSLGLSTLGGVGIMITLSVLVTLGLLRFSKREAVFFGVALTGASLIMVLTKYWFARERPSLFPDVDFWETASPSFPSGHATGSAAFFLALFFVVSRLTPRWRVFAGVSGLLLAISISASRLYLQVHYPSDILAGLLLGAGWVLGVNAVYDQMKRPNDYRLMILKLPTALLERYEAQARAKQLPLETVLERSLDNSKPAMPEASAKSRAEPKSIT